MGNKRIQIIRRASWIGIWSNGLLAVITLIVGFLARSFAVLGMGIDTTTDILTSFIALVAAKIISKPPDQDHPYGHRKAEAIATKIVSFIIFFAGAQLAYSTIVQFIEGKEHIMPEISAIYVAFVSILVKIFLAFYKYRAGRKINSSMLIADARNMRNDVLLSLTVFLGLFFTFALGMPSLDLMLAFLVSLFIMKVAYQIFMETASELLEGTEDKTVYEKIFKIVNSVPGAHKPHRTRVRKTGDFYIIDLDIEVDGLLTVTQGHDIARAAEESIKQQLGNVYDVLVHIEPLGNVEVDEKYGLNEKIIGKD